MINLGYILTAMVTPFDKELEVDYLETTRLVEHLIKTGTDSIIVAGTTGESPTLTKEEKLSLILHVKNVAGDRVKVIANAGSNNTKETIAFVKEIEAQGKADAIMLVNPFYNKPSQEGLFQHFNTIAQSTELPIMLYNIPGRTGVNVTAETMIRLSEVPNIIAVKESSGDLTQIATVIEKTNFHFKVYSGDDNLTLPILAIGGDGVASVASQVTGSRVYEMVHAFLMGDYHRAGELHRKMLPVFEGLFFTTNPVPVKAILRKQGFDVGSVRLPLVDISEEQVETIEQLMQWIDELK